MPEHQFTLFREYEFSVGQRIRIEGGRRAGDWEVAAVGDRKITLRCPLSGRELEVDKFCYFLENREGDWPEV